MDARIKITKGEWTERSTGYKVTVKKVKGGDVQYSYEHSPLNIYLLSEPKFYSQFKR